MDFPLESERCEILDKCVDHFWHHRKNIAPGKKEDPINDMLTMADGSVVPFTMGNYIKNVKLSRPRVSLLTKSKSSQQKIMDYAKKPMVVSDDDVDEFCRNELLTSTPVQRNQPSTSTLVQPSVNPEQPSQQSVSYLSEGELSEVSLPPSFHQNHQLIRSSEERRALEIERALHCRNRSKPIEIK